MRYAYLRSRPTPHVLTIAAAEHESRTGWAYIPSYTLSNTAAAVAGAGLGRGREQISSTACGPDPSPPQPSPTPGRGDQMLAASRSPEIMADAAVEIFSRPAGPPPRNVSSTVR